MRYVPEDHFERAPFTRTGPFGFRSYTCCSCGKRFATWERLKAHHPECPHDISKHLAHMKAVGPPPDMTPEDVEMAKALALLLDAA